MRGSKPLVEMGFMSPQFKALAISQDIIGWREFTEGNILSHFYAIQSFHLAMSSSYLNREDWTKQFISKILQITHSQWIFRNISFRDRKNGYLRNKTADELLKHINSLSEVSPEELPESSRFLLEINFLELSKHHLETQRYWTLAVDAALKANALEQARGERAKQVWQKLNTMKLSQQKLGIAAVEHQIRQDGMHQAGSFSNPHDPHLPRSSGGVLTQPRLSPAYGQIRGCASRIERILGITLMSDATSLACYWPFDRLLANSNRYQRGRAPSRMPGSADPFATLLW
jgi:hypothetical protein